jgi:hypothetical protein
MSKRFPWYLVTGLIIGLILALVYTWIIAPVRYTDVAPSSLRLAERDRYRAMIAMSYAANEDLGRALARLEMLGDTVPAASLAEQAQRYQVAGESYDEVKAIAQLSSAISAQGENFLMTAVAATMTADVPGYRETMTATYAINAKTATEIAANKPSPTPLRTFTPRASGTPEPTLGAPFTLQEKEQVCDPTEELVLRVLVRDAAGKEVPGVRITVTWADGQDTFFTGLFPHIGAGYADFDMTADTVYAVQVGEGGEVIPDVSAPRCAYPDGTEYWGGWRLFIHQP